MAHLIATIVTAIVSRGQQTSSRSIRRQRIVKPPQVKVQFTSNSVTNNPETGPQDRQQLLIQINGAPQPLPATTSPRMEEELQIMPYRRHHRQEVLGRTHCQEKQQPGQQEEEDKGRMDRALNSKINRDARWIQWLREPMRVIKTPLTTNTIRTTTTTIIITTAVTQTDSRRTILRAMAPMEIPRRGNPHRNNIHSNHSSSSRRGRHRCNHRRILHRASLLQ